ADRVHDRTHLPVVTVAAADLGLLSWHKKFDITDEGWLGDPLLNQLWHETHNGHPRVSIAYLNNFAAPDVVELHTDWSCQYSSWWSSAAFQRQYQQVVRDAWTPVWAQTNCGVQGPVPGGVWVRKDLLSATESPEVALSRRLAAHPSAQVVR